MDLAERVDRLEAKLRLVIAFAALLLVAVLGFAWQTMSADRSVLRARGITIVDAQGTERIWIGSPVPDPIVQGERRARSGAISGVILLDANGNERAGYATSDISGEVFIGMDSERAQEMRLIVNPGGGGHLSFFDDSANFARIGIWPGRPTLVLRQNGETVLEQPPQE